MKVVTVEQMRSIERDADSGGLSYATMMEKAGHAVAAWVERQGCAQGQRVLVLVGPGNNGGDGLVAARCLLEAGASVTLYCWKRETEGDENWKLAESAGVPVYWASDDKRYARLRRLVTQTDWILDALLGTGVARPIGGVLQELLAVVGKGVAKRQSGEVADTFNYLRPMARKQAADAVPIVVAVDTPTGLDCDTGRVDPAAVPADVTVTFAFPKVGQFLFPGAAYVGELVIADIGIPAKLSREVDLEVSTPAGIRGLLPRRPADAHKGTFGKVMVVAGSVNYTGAAYLAASAATRAGAGLVTLGVAQNLHSILASKLSEATFLLLPHEMGALVPEATKVLEERLADYSALLLGPGLGRDKKTIEFVARLLALPPVEERARLGFLGAAASRSRGYVRPLPPLVVDADGLNALADTRGWAEFLSHSAVLTPHPGEMARLLGTTIDEVEADRIGIARRAAQEWKAVVVLKGAYTLIGSPDGRVSINPFADAALATAGTGDVLAGTIAALLSQGLTPFDAAVAGAYLHGLAGQMVGKEIGPSGAVAGDLLVKLPLAMRRLVDPQYGSR